VCESARMTEPSIDAVAILGCGTMGAAILGGALQAGVFTPELVTVTGRRTERVQPIAERFGVTATTDNVAAVRASSTVILCVKPQLAKKVLTAPGLADALDGKLLVSICAGTRLSQLHAWVPGASLIRAMPNTPSVIGAGMTVLSPGHGATETDIARVERIFAAVGRCRVLDEQYLDAVTALSGSGPAFACVIIEALADGGVMMGLPRDVAVELAAQTVLGAGRLVLETGTHPAALKDSVTTPAGCTIAGLLIMEDGRIRSTLARTIQEATLVASGLGGPDEEPAS
jgi:pyrroline-5-carboxylate reductase